MTNYPPSGHGHGHGHVIVINLNVGGPNHNRGISEPTVVKFYECVGHIRLVAFGDNLPLVGIVMVM